MINNDQFVLLPRKLTAELLCELTNGDGKKNAVMKLRYSQLITEAERGGISLAAHDAEVAKKAVQAALRMYGNTDLSNKEIIALSESYASSLKK